MFQTLTGYLGAAAMLAVGILAFSVGGKAEKLGAGAYILGWIATIFVGTLGNHSGVQWGMLGIDAAILAVFGRLVWKAPRSWPVWACAFQLLTVTSHAMLIAKLPTPISAFYTVLNLTGYGILLAIAVGSILIWQERRALGLEDEDPDLA